MTLTLAGDVLLSLFLSLVADRVGRRRVLLAGASLMILSGAAFAVFENFWILLLAAVVGVISATGADFGPFRAIEESTISHLTTPETRSDVLSWYVAIASLGSAAGTEFSGRAVDFLRKLNGWTIMNAYHAMFCLYIAMGVMSLIFTLSMSDMCEITERPLEDEASERLLDERQQRDEVAGEDSNEDSQDTDPTPVHKPKTQKKSLFAQISTETRWIMYKLWFLLTVDSLADGMVSMSLTYYYSYSPASPLSSPAPLLDTWVSLTPWFSHIFRPPRPFYSSLFLRDSR